MWLPLIFPPCTVVVLPLATNAGCVRFQLEISRFHIYALSSEETTLAELASAKGHVSFVPGAVCYNKGVLTRIDNSFFTPLFLVLELLHHSRYKKLRT